VTTDKFDFQNPDYSDIIIARADKLAKLRQDPVLLERLRLWYADHPWDFINDWGVLYEPRNAEVGRPAYSPFVLWPRQQEYLQWVHTRWQTGERGLCEKSRDCGVSWLSIGYAVAMWLFHPGFAAGFGSYKEDKVDELGNPDSLLEKARIFLDRLPSLFLPTGFTTREHCAFMRVINPQNGSTIIGEVGDNIGRGARKSIQFVDEAAHIEHQELVDRSLSATTNCQIDVSSVNGNGNLFYEKRMKFDKTDNLFIFDWKQDPRKDMAWYLAQQEKHSEVTVAQEIDRDYNASQEDSFIPAKWVAAVIDAHLKLGFDGSGIRSAGFDPADTGDAKALVCRHGSIVTAAEQRTSGDITHAIPWAYDLADQSRSDVFGYDADGMGAPSMKLAFQGRAAGRTHLVAYHGSAGVLKPDELYGDGVKISKRKPKISAADLRLKKNKEVFENFRAQTWTWVRDRFQATYQAVEDANAGHIVRADPEDLISIDSKCTCLIQLQAELSRPMRQWSRNGKIKVESKVDMKKRGVSSPNLADACVIAFAMQALPEREVQRPPIMEPWSPSVPGVM